MKSLVFTAIGMTLLAQTALATSILIPQRDTRVIQYNVLAKGSKVVSEHLKGDLSGGTAQVDYAANTVSLKLAGKSNCPKGMRCSQQLRVLSVDLPIVSRKTDKCGIVTLTASEDQRPADGMLQQVTIEDYSNTTCRYFAPYIGNATYLTSYVDRMQGSTVTNKSTMKIEITSVQDGDVMQAERYYNLTNGFLVRGYSDRVSVVGGSLTIGEETAKLEVISVTACPKKAMCFAAPMPRTLTMDLKIKSRSSDDCGVETIHAEQEEVSNMEKTVMINNVVITDYSASKCDLVTPNIAQVKYERIDPRMLQPVQEANFFFNYLVAQ